MTKLACAIGTALAVPAFLFSAAALAADDGAAKAAQDYVSAYYSTKGSEILDRIHAEIPKGMDYHKELKIKDALVRGAQEATAKAGGSAVKKVELGDPRTFDGGERTTYSYEASFENGKTAKGRVQVQKLKDGSWMVPMAAKQFPPTAEECAAAYAYHASHSFMTMASSMMDSEGKKKNDDVLAIKREVPGFILQATDDDYAYLLAYPTYDKRVPQNDRKLLNFRLNTASKFNRPDYEPLFKKSYALLKALEKAGYVTMDEGLVEADYYDYFSKPKIQKVKLAGVKFAFTDKGARELLAGSESRGVRGTMIYGRAVPSLKGEVTRDGSEGARILEGGDKFTCPLTFKLQAPEGVDPKLVEDYFKQLGYDVLPRDFKERVSWHEDEKMFR
jgi:hypothetical protein